VDGTVVVVEVDVVLVDVEVVDVDDVVLVVGAGPAGTTTGPEKPRTVEPADRKSVV
jgi:hypothetical protein